MPKSTAPPAELPKKPNLLDELRGSRRDILKTAIPALLLAGISFYVAFHFVEPPPPQQLVIAAGPSDGNYFAVAEQYQRFLKEHGVELIIRETAGSVENYALLLNDPLVQLAITQGGTPPQDSRADRLESLSSLYLEPLWVFCRREHSIGQLRDLEGKRISIGEQGSGTQVLAEALLAANGVQDASAGTRFEQTDVARTMAALKSNLLDAAFFVVSPEAPLITELLQNEQLELLSFERSQAYAQRFPFLTEVVLAQGVLDLQANLPRSNVRLIAPSANLVAAPELHDAFIPLLLEIAIKVHQEGGLLNAPGEKPSLDGIEFPPHTIARHYLKFGPSFFHQYLGFWISSLIDRTKIMLVPLVVLLIPLVKLAPPVYRWRIRSRIYRWYELLRQIDPLLSSDPDELALQRQRLAAIEQELEEVSVPLSYMEEFYNLRLHIDLVKRRLEESSARNDDQPTESTLGVTK